MEDHKSIDKLSALTGGQLMTGNDVLPERTGPKPLERPATVMKTKLLMTPSYSDTICSVPLVTLCADETRISTFNPKSLQCFAIFWQCSLSDADPMMMTTR